MVQAKPTGTVTFLFTDIEGSTRLWETQPQAMGAALRQHDAILREVIGKHNGHVFKTVGDAFCSAFPTAGDAIAAAIDIQRALAAETWPAGVGALRVRMALHTGTADERDGDYFGPTLNRVARLVSAGHGGQVLVSNTTAALSGESLPAGTALIDLGTHRLRDIVEAQTVYQLAGQGLMSEFPPLRTVAVDLHHLPVRVTSLIGREQQVSEIASLLHEPDVRLVTLTGVGGTGKTRLALQVAETMADEYEHGIHFVDLSATTDPGAVGRAIVTTLEVTSRSQEEPLDLLENYLAQRQLLLVLDNFEQVVAAAPLVAQLLATAARLQVLVTSRELLRIRGEFEYLVPPLSMPLPDAGELPERLLDYEAIALFVERARAARHGFQLDQTNAHAVVEICRRLDGLPLAIELAAARVRLLGPQALLERLSQRMSALDSGGLRDFPQRQQTLRAAIDWSYDLLAPDEKHLFWRLAVFSGSFSLAAAEAICGHDLALDVTSGLESLVTKSLLRLLEMPDGAMRFAFLETIGEYGRERLTASDESEDVRRRHAGYYGDLAKSLGDAMRTHRQLEWYDRLAPESYNLRTALAYLMDGIDIASGIEAVAVLNDYWLYTYQYAESKTWLERARAMLDQASQTVQIDVLAASGVLAAYMGLQADGLRYLERAISLAEALRDPKRGAWAQMWWAANAISVQDPRAQQRALQGLQAMRDVGYLPGVSQGLNIYGEALRAGGDLTAAEAVYHEVITVARAAGDYRRLIMQHVNLGMIAYERGDVAATLANAELGLPDSLTYHVEETTVMFLLMVAQAASAAERDETAALLLGAAEGWYADMSVRPQYLDIPVERKLVSEIQQSVAAETLELGRRRGAALGLRAVVPLALEEIAYLRGGRG